MEVILLHLTMKEHILTFVWFIHGCQGTVIVEAEAAHGDDHAEEMGHMEEMGHGDGHTENGVEDIQDQFTASVSSGVIHHIGANADDDTLLVHLFGADDDGELKITLNSKIS